MNPNFLKQVSARIEKMLIKNALIPVVTVALSMLLTGCYGDGGGYNASFEGTVIESVTGKPIAGAYVIAEWTHNGHNIVGTNTSCPRVEVVMTDANGRYKIPPVFISSFFGTYRSVYAFKAGFKNVPRLSENEDWRAARMVPFEETADKRLASYNGYAYLTGCGKEEEYTPKLIPLFRAIYDEAKTLVVSAEQREELKGTIEFFKNFGLKDENSNEKKRKQ